MSLYKEYLKVGILQTNVDCNFAWKDECGKTLRFMNPEAEEKVADEIRKGFKYFSEMTNRPQMILIPEYSIPKSIETLVEYYANKINVVVFCGLDLVSLSAEKVANRGKIIVPYSWPDETIGKSKGQSFHWGKTYFALEELDWFFELQVKPVSEKVNYVIDAGDYGIIGVALCSDFYDLDRFLIYKGRVHHLFIVSYNKDESSFEVLTEALSRLLMCNVVICNTGHYGNSLAFSPYVKREKRLIYKAVGADLYTVQSIDLPLKQLDCEQEEATKIDNINPVLSKNKNAFKWPPGYLKKTIRFIPKKTIK